jgi:hypothetical protein
VTTVKWLKLAVAFLLMPAVVALAMTAWEAARALTFGQGTWQGQLGIAFCAGYVLWLTVFALLPPPMRTYVLGHELTHAIWALLMGARVSDMRVGKTGGQVKTDKLNWAIALAPYFFPFYAMLFMAIFFAAHAIWGLDRYFVVLFFLVGLGWSFHVTFTLMMLLHTRQTDVQSQGIIFSAVIIVAINLLTMLVVAICLSRTITVRAVTTWLGQDLAWVYGWVLDKVLLLWHRAR